MWPLSTRYGLREDFLSNAQKTTGGGAYSAPHSGEGNALAFNVWLIKKYAALGDNSKHNSMPVLH